MKNKGLLETVYVCTKETVVHNVNEAHKNGLGTGNAPERRYY